MALVELQNRGILKYLISQNCDGLHRKSGMLPVSLAVSHARRLMAVDHGLVDLRTEYLNFTVTATASIARTVEKNIFVVCELSQSIFVCPLKGTFDQIWCQYVESS